jgi:hypothetical protein
MKNQLANDLELLWSERGPANEDAVIAAVCERLRAMPTIAPSDAALMEGLERWHSEIVAEWGPNPRADLLKSAVERLRAMPTICAGCSTPFASYVAACDNCQLVTTRVLRALTATPRPASLDCLCIPEKHDPNVTHPVTGCSCERCTRTTILDPTTHLVEVIDGDKDEIGVQE